jgi:non-ribosomal peptide synthetase component F
VRTQVRSEETVAEYLRRLQERQAAARDFEYTSLVKVQGWSDVPPATPLFENILVFENYPVDAALRQKNASAIELSGFRNFAVTNYPLSLRVFPGKELRLDLTFRTRFHDEKSAERLVEHMAVLLEQMAADPGRRVGQLSLLMENERRQFIDDWNEEEEELDTVEN